MSSTEESQKKKVLYVHSMIERIGHLAIEPFYLRNLYPADKFDVEIVTFPVESKPKTNRALFDIAMRSFQLNLSDDETVHKLMEYTKDPIVEMDNTIYNIDVCWMIYEFNKRYRESKTVPYTFSLNEAEKERGRKLRTHLGIPHDARIITVHAREGGYLPHRAYHSYRDVDISNYIPAMEHLLKQGYYLIRLGDQSMKRLPDLSPRLIDAPFHPAYDSFFEPYFIAESEFYMGMNSGPNAIAMAFNVPFLCLNSVQASLAVFYDESFFVPKHIYSTQLGRMLTYEEQITSPNFLGLYQTEQFEKLGLQLVENTPEEIMAGVREMETRLAGCYPDIELGNELKTRQHLIESKLDSLNSDFGQNGSQPYGTYVAQSSCSTEFLKMNPYYLGHSW